MLRRALRILHWSLLLACGAISISVMVLLAATQNRPFETREPNDARTFVPFSELNLPKFPKVGLFVGRNKFRASYTCLRDTRVEEPWYAFRDQGVKRSTQIGQLRFWHAYWRNFVDDTEPPQTLHWVGVYGSLWQVLAIFAVYPAAALPILALRRYARNYQRYHRKQLGLCTRCAYDLRGSPSGRCPECGEKI